MWDFLVVVGITLFLLSLGFFIGGYNERRHFADLGRRELAAADFISTQSKHYLGQPVPGHPPTMIVKEVIIASDYLKTFLASLKNIFGGEVHSFETLLERARREALMRIVEEARANGYNAICNLRMETAEIGGNMQGKGIAMASILASATAYRTSLS